MREDATRVLELLQYLEEVEKARRKPAYAIPKDHFHVFEHELYGLPELQCNLQSDTDDVWLRIPRLQQIAEPLADDDLKPWLQIYKSPKRAPTLKSEAVFLTDKGEERLEKLTDHPRVQQFYDWYVSNQWQPWAEAERSRRAVMHHYGKLYMLHQTMTLEGAETALELVWGIGHALWKKAGQAAAIQHPLLVQLCEVRLNPLTFDLEVRPRDAESTAELGCYFDMNVTGAQPFEDFVRVAVSQAVSRLNPFEPDTFEGLLKAGVTNLDPEGSYVELKPWDSPGGPDEKLRVTNTWVLFARKRSADYLLADIKRLKEGVEKASELPGVVRQLVESGDDTVRIRAEQHYRGLSTSQAGTGAHELYFPMPYNDEQLAIVQKLHDNDGVVVQGPPGTGKTHTIANVICHYLARGKRVLVTAYGETALQVVKEKLPERIRDLTVALLSDERDGMKQFEHSIETISREISSFNAPRAQTRIKELEEKLDIQHGKLASLDRRVAERARQHVEPFEHNGRRVTAEELARTAIEQAEAHQWFDDSPPAPTPVLAEADVNSLRAARMTVASDLLYLGSSLPATEEFPAWEEILTLRRDLMAAQALDASVLGGDVLALADRTMTTYERAVVLTAHLTEHETVAASVAAGGHWLCDFAKRIEGLSPEELRLRSLLDLCIVVNELEHQRIKLLVAAVLLPAEAELSEEFQEALGRVLDGKRAFFVPFGKTQARQLLAEVRVEDRTPRSGEEWELVRELLKWRNEARKSIARWRPLCAEFGLPEVPTELEAGFRTVVQSSEDIKRARRLAWEFTPGLRARLSEVFGGRIADRFAHEGEALLKEALASLRAHVEKNRLAYARQRIAALTGKLTGHRGAIVDALRTFLASTLADSRAEERVLESGWLELREELERVNSLAPALAEIERTSAAIERAGAPKWAQRVRIEPAGGDADFVVRASWREAWSWRAAVEYLDQIDDHRQMRLLFEDRRKLTTALSRTYEELVAEKAWLGVYMSCTDTVRQALAAYREAVGSLGKGTGVRSARHRKDARTAMSRAYKAVPCWVLPEWRVSEAIPAELGLFDLVVVDEASQSGLWALPALLRGKKVLVVGDDKQVSPEAVGISEELIKQMDRRFLAKQPHRAQLALDKSIYDLATVVFAGNSVMLREHFRSVPAIIEFSNKHFYRNDIRPLRLPRANERLDPPLVDVYVEGGERKNDVNKAEAKAIVDEIEVLLADKQFAGRTIGVVTLHGNKQASHIQQLISARIPAAEVQARKISAGQPAAFQGRERDIMMVSMVNGPTDRAQANTLGNQQRFNVALSRARDRMYLFRSVNEYQLGADTLPGLVLEHFRKPFRQNAGEVEGLRALCESGFELEMFDALAGRGYRVKPQVECAGRRIDFVVEGGQGRRLALECDGDRYHGPDRWPHDMERQRMLERAGWTFWRCFASSFLRHREEVLADLVRTLEDLGIEPLGAESVDTSVWVHTKTVDPFEVRQKISDGEGEAADEGEGGHEEDYDGRGESEDELPRRAHIERFAQPLLAASAFTTAQE